MRRYRCLSGYGAEYCPRLVLRHKALDEFPLVVRPPLMTGGLAQLRDLMQPKRAPDALKDDARPLAPNWRRLEFLEPVALPFGDTSRRPLKDLLMCRHYLDVVYVVELRSLDE